MGAQILLTPCQQPVVMISQCQISIMNFTAYASKYNILDATPGGCGRLEKSLFDKGSGHDEVQLLSHTIGPGGRGAVEKGRRQNFLGEH